MSHGIWPQPWLIELHFCRPRSRLVDRIILNTKDAKCTKSHMMWSMFISSRFVLFVSFEFHFFQD